MEKLLDLAADVFVCEHIACEGVSLYTEQISGRGNLGEPAASKYKAAGMAAHSVC